MPYIEICLIGEKTEEEAREVLEYIREHFPCAQSEGRFYRMSSDSIVFEQAEHTGLTLEQKDWVERYGEDRIGFFPYADLYADQEEGCRCCGQPFDESPTGFCSCCSRADPYRTSSISLTFSPDEFNYVQRVDCFLWSMDESSYVRKTAITMLSMLEHGHLSAGAVGNPSSYEQLEAVASSKEFICFYCHTPFRGRCKRCNRRDDKEMQSVDVTFTRQEYQQIQQMAESCGMDLVAFLRRSLCIPEIHLAMASAQAAVGRIFGFEMEYTLAHIEEPVKVEPYSVLDHHGRVLNPYVSGIARESSSLMEDYPLVALKVPNIIVPPGEAERRLQESSVVYLEQVKTRLAELHSIVPNDCIPCTPDEIHSLEKEAGKFLPAVYKEFLMWMGNGAGKLMQYVDCFHPSLYDFQRAASTLLARDRCVETLPEDAFVFFMEHDQEFAFFRTTEGNDPPVYVHKREWRRDPFRKVYHRFSDWLAIEIEMHADCFADGKSVSYSSEQRRAIYEATMDKILATLARKQREEA